MSRLITRWVSLAGTLLFLAPIHAKDYYLTIGGGYAPSGNQASLERNVLFFQRVLGQPIDDQFQHDIFFSDGQNAAADLQVLDRASVPKANRLMAEFLGSFKDLGLQYRNHEIRDAEQGTNPENIKRWFKEVGGQMESGDRLCLYVTAHGGRSGDKKDPYNTTIATWNRTSIKMKELVSLLDDLDPGVMVVAIMVQCHSGGFSHFIYEEGDPGKGLSSQRRVGFFATVHDRPAAGCTPEVNEKDYAEYSSFFWAAVAGVDRMGQPIEVPDYNNDGIVSFDEAHAYTLLTADTIDLPIKTSGEFLHQCSKFADDDEDSETDLLGKSEAYELVLKLASPIEEVVLESLSQQLGLTGSDRLQDVNKQLTSLRGPGRRRGSFSISGMFSSKKRQPESEQKRLRGEIRDKLLEQWPALSNTLNPIATELLTDRSAEFIAFIEGQPGYAKYRELTENKEMNETEKRVKYERFLRTAYNVIRAENLRRLNNTDKVAEYEMLIEAESQTLAHSR